ncbi:GDSL-type esterase/lipase family protein [uncultured Cyclobacterium sp.]|uniref:GDSL-type esterase/lipase family protein n=1 Tax=uncultured Cyclobacterium sp. TaxID=453820 RepID=UPI0030ED392D
MRINYHGFLLFSFFYLALFPAQAENNNDSTSSKNGPIATLEIRTIETKGKHLLHISQEIDQDLLSINPDVVFIMAGKNDMTQFHTPKAEHSFKSSYQKIISGLKQNGIETVLFNLPSLSTDNNGFNLPDFKASQQFQLNKANAIIQSLAKANEIKWIDIKSAYANNNSTPGSKFNSDKAISPKIANRIAALQAYQYLENNKKLDKKLTVLFLSDATTESKVSREKEKVESIQYHFEKLVNWQKIAPYFAVPDKYKEDRGTFKDPFIFDDQSKVTSLKDWKKRRQEILNAWHAYMGEWPKLIENPSFEVLSSVNKADYIQKKIRFEWIPGQMTQGYLLVPYQANNLPAVVTVYYEPETAIGEGKEERDFALQLAKRGFVTLSIGTTETTENKTYALYHPHIDSATVEPLSLLAYAAANAWHLLASLPEVNKEKIGIMGHSYGGKWAMFASCLFENFAAAAWSDPGIVFDQKRPNINYWEPWYLGYHPRPRRERGVPNAANPARGTYLQLLKDNRDLHELHVLMAPRPFLVSGGEEDGEHRWVPLNHSIQANKLYGYNDRVGMSNRPEHSPNPKSNAIIYNFFDYFLK